MGDGDQSNNSEVRRDGANEPLSKNSGSGQSVKRPEPTPPKQK
jgi:hypothetical protein